MLRAVTAMVLSGFFVLMACSGKYVDEEGETSGEPPPKQCREFATTWCTKFFDCYVKVGRLPAADKQKNITACYDEINTSLPCSDVQTIYEDDYDSCLSQVKGLSCAKFDVPRTQVGTIKRPASCDTAMSFD